MKKEARKVFQVFKSGHADYHEEVLLPTTVLSEDTSSIQVNEDEALYPIGVKIEDD